MQSNGLPANFYDQTDDFQALIAGDVSPSELQARVEQGYRAVADADPQVINQMRTLYGVGEGELAAYFLDPTRAVPLLTRQARAAQISARGVEQAGIQLTSALAEDLASRGITAAEAERGFAEIGALGELRQQFAGEQAISTEELVTGTLASDVEAQKKLAERQRLRTKAFEGGGSFTRTTGETSGRPGLVLAPPNRAVLLSGHVLLFLHPTRDTAETPDFGVNTRVMLAATRTPPVRVWAEGVGYVR